MRAYQQRTGTAAKRRARYHADAAYRERILASNRPYWQRAQAARRLPPRAPLPLPYIGHPLLERARAIAGPAWYGDDVYQPAREDAAGEAVVALLTGGDPCAAARASLAAEAAWRRRTVPLAAWRE